jgi:hypothetical protein
VLAGSQAPTSDGELTYGLRTGTSVALSSTDTTNQRTDIGASEG